MLNGLSRLPNTHGALLCIPTFVLARCHRTISIYTNKHFGLGVVPKETQTYALEEPAIEPAVFADLTCLEPQLQCSMHTHTRQHTHTHSLSQPRASRLGPPLDGRRCHEVSMCDAGSTWGPTMKTQPSPEVLFTDQRAVTSQTRETILRPPSLKSTRIESVLY